MEQNRVMLSCSKDIQLLYIYQITATIYNSVDEEAQNSQQKKDDLYA
jgi:hypothetical protein